MKTAMEKVDVASRATEKVFKHVREALRFMKENTPTNGYGVFHYPNQVRLNLSLAAAELKKAADLIDGIAWPTDRDYDEVGA